MASNASHTMNSTTPMRSPLALPSLHTLGLPDPFAACSRSSFYDSDAKTTTHDDIMSRWHRSRQSSISSTSSSSTSSSATITARPTSPCDSVSSSDSGRSSTTPPPSSLAPSRCKLVASTAEEADAFVIVPPTRNYVQNISALSRANAASGVNRRDQALLITGSALQYLRHPRFRLAKGARMHPYRIVSRPDRRSSSNSQESTNDL